MNLRHVLHQLGLLLLVLSAAMTLTIAGYEGWLEVARDHAEPLASLAGLASAFLGGLLGGGLWLYGRRGKIDQMTRREAMLLVALSWLVGAALSGMPFFIWAHLAHRGPDAHHEFHSFIASYFEAMSGLTTTGATVLSDIESLPKGLLLWRSALHWFGGLGIVVLFVAVLPMIGVGGKRLFQVEAPGPKAQGVRPRIRETARTLWLIYVGLTILQTLALRLAGMSWFDALAHTFATLGTGGFSTRNASAGAADFTIASQYVIILFMALAGVNFGLYYSLVRRRVGSIFHDPELRFYLASIAVAAVVIFFYLWHAPITLTTGQTIPSASFEQAARHSLFQVVSIHTTTGFATADFDLWPFLPQALLIGVMFIGGCAGSTGGGIKAVRILLCFKIIRLELERVFRPNVVRAVRLGKSPVDAPMRESVLIFTLLILLLFALGGIAINLIEGDKFDFTSSATASIACLMNIGPGLNEVGAVRNYGFFSDPSKALLSLLMVLGRLEVYAILVLLTPGFWRKD